MKRYIYIIIVLFALQNVNAQVKASGFGSGLSTTDTSCPTFFPEVESLAENKFVVFGWVKEKHASQQVEYVNSAIKVLFYDDSGVEIPAVPADAHTFYPSGKIIEGWQRIVGIFKVPLDYSRIKIELKAGLTDTSIDSYFDDIRVVPFNGNIKSFVYDEQTQRLMAEMDENNYATFYEYGLEGELLRVKKETERGIYTIQETRSGNAKNVIE